MKKNVASQIIGAEMLDASTGAAFSGTVTCYVTGDNGTQALGSVSSGICVSKGNGLFNYVPAQAETNYDFLQFTFIGTGAVAQTVELYTEFPQTGDSYARIGATGSGLTSLAPSATALSTAVWTSPPTGFLAATFPTGTIANTTNITAGTIATVTTLTNLPAAPTDWLTAAAVKADAVTKIQSGLSTLTQAQVTGGSYALNSSSFAFNAAMHVGIDWGNIANPDANNSFSTTLVHAVETVAEVAGPVQGDVQGKVLGGGASDIEGIGARSVDGSGNAIAPAATALSTSVWTSAIAGRIDVAISSRSTLAAADVRAALGLAAANLDPQLAAILAASGGGGTAPTASEVAIAVVDQTLSGHTTAGTVGKALLDAQASGNPLESIVPGDYADGTAGAALGRLNNTPPDAPIVILPDLPTNTSRTVVFCDTSKITGIAGHGTEATFTMTETNPAKTMEGVIVSDRVKTVKANKAGRIAVELLRGFEFKVDAPGMKFNGATFTTGAEPFDLASLIS